MKWNPNADNTKRKSVTIYFSTVDEMNLLEYLQAEAGAKRESLSMCMRRILDERYNKERLRVVEKPKKRKE